MRNLNTDLNKTVMPLTYGFSWLQEVGIVMTTPIDLHEAQEEVSITLVVHHDHLISTTATNYYGANDFL